MTEKKEVNPETGELIEDYEKMFEINTAEYDGREEIVIDFKDGQRLLLRDAEKMIDASRTASEPVVGRNTAKEVLGFLRKENPTKEEFIKHFTSKGLNRGGAMLGEQTEMAFMQEGGLKDDGMDRDPISGNEVPSGSLAEEVRDDIPAQLSEGEYVVPADVVRFFGIKFFEDLRMQAKMGLNQMERSGRIGGEPIAVEIETSEETLDPKDEEKIRDMLQGFSEGAVVTDKDFQEDAEKKIFDPSKFGTVGTSYIKRRRDVPTNEEILAGKKDGKVKYYHPDGQVVEVLYVNGEIVNDDQVRFTQPPWSLTKPKGSADVQATPSSPSIQADESSDSSDREYYADSLISGFDVTAPAKSLSTADLARQYGGQALYYDKEKNNVIKMTDAAYQGLVSDYNRLDLADKGVSFQDWYNTPTTTKISMSFNSLLGYEPTKEQIDEALANAKRQPSLFKDGLFGYIRKFVSDKTTAKGATDKKDLPAAPPKTALEELAEGNVSSKFLKTDDKTKIDPTKYFEEIGKGTPLGTTRVDKFLLGIDENTTPEQLARIEKNRQDVQKDALKTHMKEVAKITGDPIRREEEASQSPGDLDTVAEVQAFEQQMADAYDAAGRGTPNPFGGGSNAPQQATSGFGYFVNKGGLASKPKAKPKRKKNTKGLGTKPKAT